MGSMERSSRIRPANASYSLPVHGVGRKKEMNREQKSQSSSWRMEEDVLYVGGN